MQAPAHPLLPSRVVPLPSTRPPPLLCTPQSLSDKLGWYAALTAINLLLLIARMLQLMDFQVGGPRRRGAGAAGGCGEEGLHLSLTPHISIHVLCWPGTTPDRRPPLGAPTPRPTRSRAWAW